MNNILGTISAKDKSPQNGIELGGIPLKIYPIIKAILGQNKPSMIIKYTISS